MSINIEDYLPPDDQQMDRRLAGPTIRGIDDPELVDKIIGGLVITGVAMALLTVLLLWLAILVLGAAEVIRMVI